MEPPPIPTTGCVKSTVVERFVKTLGWEDIRLHWQGGSDDTPLPAIAAAEDSSAEYRMGQVDDAGSVSVTAMGRAEDRLLTMAQPWAAEEKALTILLPNDPDDNDDAGRQIAPGAPPSDSPFPELILSLYLQLKTTQHYAVLNQLLITLRIALISGICVDRFAATFGWSPRKQVVRQSFKRWNVARLKQWLDGVQALASPMSRNNPWLADSALLHAHHLIHQGASPEDIEPFLPLHKLTRARRAFLMGEAAFRCERLGEAEDSFRSLTHLAPHVTVGHRRLGQIALCRGDFEGAARHFEAAVATPNQPYLNADLSDRVPLRIFSAPDWSDVYWFRGQLFAVRWRSNSKGIAVVGDRLVHVVDSPAYRLWVRLKDGQLDALTRRLRAMASPEQIAGTIRGRAQSLLVHLPLVGWLARLIAHLLTPSSKPSQIVERKERHGRLHRWLRHSLPALYRSPAGRVLRIATGPVGRRHARLGMVQLHAVAVLFVLRVVFVSRPVPPSQRDTTLVGLLRKLNLTAFS